MLTNHSSRSLVVVLGLLMTSTGLAQTTVQVPCSADTTLYENATGGLSNGVGSYIFAGKDVPGLRRRALLAFDIAASVPAGARVIDASLFLYCSRWNGAQQLPVFLHRATKAWGEGNSNAPGQEGGGAAAATGDATWLHNSFPATNWTNAGGDFEPQPSGSALTAFRGNTFTGAGLLTDVQTWLDAPATNFGWLAKTDEQNPRDVRRFDSRQGTAANRPLLTITYLLPGDSASFGLGCAGSGSQPLTLTALGTPSGGSTLHLDLSNGTAGALAAQWISFDFDAPGAQTAGGCRLFLTSPNQRALLAPMTLDASGAATSTLQIPPGVASTFFALQAVAHDPAAGFVLSNAWVAVVR